MSAKRIDLSKTSENPLFDLEKVKSEKPQRCAYEGHVWTRNKAKLIERYLWRFVQVTKSGAYIDAFSGTQRKESWQETWAAKLALCSEPKWLTRFYLFEQDPKKVDHLRELAKEHHQGWRLKSSRKVEVIRGDSNVEIPKYFSFHKLKQKLPTFCLLDQHTRECSWDLVKFISRMKTSGCKVEIFYFLAQGWMDRHWEILKPRNQARIRAWWGRDDWSEFRMLASTDRAALMENRFRNELGYQFAQAFPIHKYGNHGRVMFWMIHASDDCRALPLMAASYREIGLNLPPLPIEQIDFNYLQNADDGEI